MRMRLRICGDGMGDCGDGFGGCGVGRAWFVKFRHADGTLDFQRFTRCSCGPGCADRDRAVSLSLAAAQRVVRFTPDCEVGEWWWFENSRAYLYYFFIVNDCQFVAGHADAWCRGIGQTAARFLCDAPFLIRRSSIFLFRESSCRCLFMKRFFLWRVRFWLRMNAGGVLNTCKSNGIHRALLGGESGERVSNA